MSFIESKDNVPHPFRPGVEIQEDNDETDPFGQIDNELTSGGAQTIENEPPQENLPDAANGTMTKETSTHDSPLGYKSYRLLGLQ